MTSLPGTPLARRGPRPSLSQMIGKWSPSFSSSIRGSRKVPREEKEGKKWCPRWVAVDADRDNDDNEKADDSNMEYIVSAKHVSKCQT
jgi:hypothetical protein